MASVCVFCGANPGNDPVLTALAHELGASLAARAHTVVYGGGRVGLMGTVADAALGSGGDVVGFIPQALKDREVAHLGLTELVVTDSMHARKQAMCDRSDGFIALPGGYGTLDEVMDEVDALRSGGRSVGIVSHLVELRTRIPSQITVCATPAGSTISTPITSRAREASVRPIVPIPLKRSKTRSCPRSSASSTAVP